MKLHQRTAVRTVHPFALHTPTPVLAYCGAQGADQGRKCTLLHFSQLCNAHNTASAWQYPTVLEQPTSSGY